MKKMISIVLVSLVLGSSAGVQADTWVANTAKNQRGLEVHPDYGGFDATRITSPKGEMVCTGRCVLAGLIPSTGIVGALYYVYDTAVVNPEATGSSINDRLKVVGNFWPMDTGGPGQPRVPKSIRFVNGIYVRLSSIAGGENVTVLYSDADQR